MAWVSEGSSRYYYRSVRRGRKVLREYYGGGEEARLAAALDAERRRQREADLQLRRDARDAFESASGPLDRLIAVTDLLVRATLLARGFHQHHQGEWRRRIGHNA